MPLSDLPLFIAKFILSLTDFFLIEFYQCFFSSSLLEEFANLGFVR